MNSWMIVGIDRQLGRGRESIRSGSDSAHRLLNSLTLSLISTQFFAMVLSLQQITEAALHLNERDRLDVTTALWRSLGGER